MAELSKSSIKHVVLVSGPIASGKTTLSQALKLRFGFSVLSTRGLLISPSRNRRALQAVGVSLDVSTAGRWVRDALLGLQSQLPLQSAFVVDSVRTVDQVRWIRGTFGASVTHVHLTASLEALSYRYHIRSEGLSYEEVVDDPVEERLGLLGSSADLVVDTEHLRFNPVVERVANYLLLGS